ncbi:hypothetical protein [Photobacterium kasasachensis]|uniref:hypothetical protein n=1 Tax=Photobacterium kasasachensis TaxID=2910240 RepID=UPI003D0BBBEF
MIKLDFFYKITIFFLLVQTVVVTNSIKGLLVPYVSVILFTAILFLKLHQNDVKRFFYELSIALLVFVALVLPSQLSNLILNNGNFINFSLWISSDSPELLSFRSSFFTQGIYFLICLMFFYATNYSLRKGTFSEINKFLRLGLIFFIAYGYFSYLSFFIFGKNIDFLSNRLTGADTIFGGIYQFVNLGGLTLPRFQSLTGEPSMFAFSIFPFFIYFYYMRDKFMYMNLLVVLLLSTSGTAIVGFATFIIMDSILYRKARNFLVVFSILLASLVVFNFSVILDFAIFFISKLNSEHISGVERLSHIVESVRYFGQLSWLNQLFGIGFGYSRSTNGFTTILLNNGLIGLVFVLGVYLYPLVTIKTNNNPAVQGIKMANITVLVMMLISVPEFYNLHIYFLLSLLFNIKYIGTKYAGG